MADEPNLFGMAESAINAVKKPEIVKNIMRLKHKVVIGEEIKSLIKEESRDCNTIVVTALHFLTSPTL